MLAQSGHVLETCRLLKNASHSIFICNLVQLRSCLSLSPVMISLRNAIDEESPSAACMEMVKFDQAMVEERLHEIKVSNEEMIQINTIQKGACNSETCVRFLAVSCHWIHFLFLIAFLSRCCCFGRIARGRHRTHLTTSCTGIREHAKRTVQVGESIKDVTPRTKKILVALLGIVIFIQLTRVVTRMHDDQTDNDDGDDSI